jgi:aryl-alcohol dehydrogenase-like predicted oxidoreductase
VRCDARPESVRRDVEQSLARLGTEYLDLVQVHQPDFETPFAETMGALEDLRRRGLVRAIGASNATAHELRAMQRALGATPLASVQSPWSLADRRFERDVLPTARKLGLGVLAYSPLDGGRIARAEGPVGKLLAEQREELGLAPAALALAWLLAREGLSAAIVGASSLAQLEDLRAALAQPILPRHEEMLERFLPAPKLDLRRRVRRAAATILRAVGLRGRS